MKYKLYEKREVITGNISSLVVKKTENINLLKTKFNVFVKGNDVIIDFKDIKEFEKFRIFVLDNLKVRNMSFEGADLILDFVE